MRSPKLLSVAAGTLLFAGALSLGADEYDKLTKVTFSGPVEVPGKTLPAGTYVFKLLDEPSDRNIVEIYDADQQHLLDLVLAVSDQRVRPRSKNNVLMFAERPAGSPEAVKGWFYPGSTYGEEFVYPHDRALELAKQNHEAVYSTHSDLSGYGSKHLKSGKDPDAVKMKKSDIKQVQPNGDEGDVTTH